MSNVVPSLGHGTGVAAAQEDLYKFSLAFSSEIALEIIRKSAE